VRPSGGGDVEVALVGAEIADKRPRETAKHRVVSFVMGSGNRAGETRAAGSTAGRADIVTGL
jgi:hypothetical protein